MRRIYLGKYNRSAAFVCCVEDVWEEADDVEEGGDIIGNVLGFAKESEWDCNKFWFSLLAIETDVDINEECVSGLWAIVVIEESGLTLELGAGLVITVFCFFV